MKIYTFIIIFIIFFIVFGNTENTQSVNVDFLENKGNQLQPPLGIPENKKSSNEPLIHNKQVENLKEISEQKNIETITTSKEYHNWLFYILAIVLAIIITFFIFAILF